MQRFFPTGMGCIPDLPDPRDLTERNEEIKPLLNQLSPTAGEVPEVVDLRLGDEGEVFIPASKDQGSLNCSSVFAVLGLLEYFERRLSGRTFDGSQLFVYKISRNMRFNSNGKHGDTGTGIRTTFKAIARFGIPDETLWPYDPERESVEPNAFVYQSAKRFDRLRYFRLSESTDTHQTTRWELLTSFLSAGFPLVIGFSVPSSLSKDSDIPHRVSYDRIRGGQAVLAIGYELHKYGRGQHALLIKSSWGKRWGNGGFGYLSERHLLTHVFPNIWTCIDPCWGTPSELNRPALVRS